MRYNVIRLRLFSISNMNLEFSDLKQLHLAFNSKFYMRVIS